MIEIIIFWIALGILGGILSQLREFNKKRTIAVYDIIQFLVFIVMGPLIGLVIVLGWACVIIAESTDSLFKWIEREYPRILVDRRGK